MTALHVVVRLGSALVGMSAIAIGCTIAAVIKYAADDCRGSRSLV